MTEQSKKFSLVEFTTKHMTRKKEVVLPGNNHFYPSESAVSWIDKYGIKRVAGACARQVYFRLTLEGARDIKLNKHNSWIFALGKAVEIILVEQWKQAGIWVANNVKFYNKKYNLSGEMDCILRNPETNELFIVEVKSFYNYYATKQIVGNKSQKGRPKTGQLLQLLLYLNESKEYFKYGSLYYAARDSSARKEFVVSIQPDPENPTLLWPVVDGVVDKRFTVNAIYDRYELLARYIRDKELPPADYEMVFSPSKVEKLKQIGDISKSKYEKWKKNPKTNPIGDWNCSYCQFSDICWNKDGTKKA